MELAEDPRACDRSRGRFGGSLRRVAGAWVPLSGASRLHAQDPLPRSIARLARGHCGPAWHRRRAVRRRRVSCRARSHDPRPNRDAVRRRGRREAESSGPHTSANFGFGPVFPARGCSAPPRLVPQRLPVIIVRADTEYFSADIPASANHPPTPSSKAQPAAQRDRGNSCEDAQGGGDAGPRQREGE